MSSRSGMCPPRKSGENSHLALVSLEADVEAGFAGDALDVSRYFCEAFVLRRESFRLAKRIDVTGHERHLVDSLVLDATPSDHRLPGKRVERVHRVVTAEADGVP